MGAAILQGPQERPKGQTRATEGHKARWVWAQLS